MPSPSFWAGVIGPEYLGLSQLGGVGQGYLNIITFKWVTHPRIIILKLIREASKKKKKTKPNQSSRTR